MNKVKVLITGVGAPGSRGTIYALRNNSDSQNVQIIGTDSVKDSAGRYLVDRFYRLPPAGSDEYVSTLLDVCVREDVKIVLPQTTKEVRVLSVVSGVLERHGIRVGVAAAEVIAIANNKVALLDLFSSLGLPHPRYKVVESEQELIEAAIALGYPDLPVVVRPPESNGMRGFRILRPNAWDVRRFLEEKPDGLEVDLEDLLRVLRRGSEWPTLLVTEYLEGPEYSVDAFRGQYVFAAVPRLRHSIRSGITFVAKIEAREDLLVYTRRATEALGLELAFGFQFKLDADGVAKILECNPRIQGTMVASVLAGYNIPWWAVRELMGKPVLPEEVPASIPSNTFFYRYWGGLGVSDGEVLASI